MKKILFYTVSIITFLTLQGCAILGFGESSPQTPAPMSEVQDPNNPKLTSLVGKNYIKGVVKSLKRDNNANAWNYVIEGVDMSNGKLSYVNFNHKSVVANEGDLVHASFDGMRMVDLLIIKAGYFKGGQKNTATPTKKAVPEKGAGKRDKAHQILSVPQEEFVKLN